MRWCCTCILGLLLTVAGSAPAWAFIGNRTAGQGEGGDAGGPPVVRAAVLRDFPPFFLVEEDGTPSGFAVDAMDEIARLAGLKVQYVIGEDWADGQRLVREGLAELMVGLAPTDERRVHFAFTAPIFVSPPSIMVRANNTSVRSIADLTGRILACLHGSIIPPDVVSVPGVRILHYSNAKQYIFDLLSGNVDAVFGGRYELQYLVNRAGVEDLVEFVATPQYEFKRSLALRLGQDELLARLEPAVLGFVGSEGYLALIEKWYGKPQPFWNVARLVTVLGLAFAVTLLLLGLLHYRQVLKLNRRLSSALESSRLSAGELAQSRDMFRQLVENIRYVFWLRELPSKRIVYVSPAYRAIFGREEQTLYEDPFSYLNAIHPEDRPAVERAMLSLHASSAPFVMEFRIVPGPGVERWVSSRAFHLPATGDLPERVVGILEDVTEHKLAELALQESETLFRALFMDSSVVMLLVDPETGALVEANHAAAAYYGWSREQLKAKRIMEINTLTPEELAKEMQAAREKRKRHFSFRHRLADGRVRDVEVYSGPVALQGKQLLYSCIIDVTARREAQERLQRSEEFQRAIVSCSPVALYSLDLAGRVLSWNTSAQRVYGWSAEEVLGKPLPIVGPEQEEEFAKLRARAAAGEPLLGLELTRMRKDGSQIQISLSTATIKDSAGQPIGVLGAAQDITARKQAELAILQAKEAAEAANLAKSEFLTNMSHEIRTPLNGFMGMLQLLESTPLSQEQAEYVVLAKRSCKRLTSLLSDILDLARLESGYLELQEQPFAPAEVLERLEGIFAPLAREKGLEFHCRLDPALPELLHGDPVRLQQVLMNLLGNAFKFTATGSVILEGGPLPARRPGEYRVLFTVADTGIGIPDEKLDALFRPFAQVSEGFTRPYQGAGLGLAICRRLVERMGGTMDVESELGQGTTMYFSTSFALPEPLPAEAPEPLAVQSGVLSGLRVLVVEDDQISGVVAAKLLEKAGATALVVADGSQALEALRQEPFGLVLMDVQMPVMDGVEATRAIRDGAVGEAGRTLPVVAMTAYAMSGDRETFLAAGMDDYLAKPLEMDDLLRVAVRLLARGN